MQLFKTIIAATGNPVRLVGGPLTHAVPNGSTAQVLERLNVDGKEEQNASGSGIISVGTWLLWGSASDFECRYDATGDTPAGDPLNTWLQLNVSRSWSHSNSNNNSELDTIGTLRIRRVGTAFDLDSVSLSLNAIVGTPP